LEFAGHGTVNHSAEEFASGKFWYTNNAEAFFAFLTGAVYGQFANSTMSARLTCFVTSRKQTSNSIIAPRLGVTTWSGSRHCYGTMFFQINNTRARNAILEKVYHKRILV